MAVYIPQHTTLLKQTKSGIRFLNVRIPEYPLSISSVWVNAGSIFDPLGKEGLAHFFEHTLFVETKKFPQRQKRLEEVERNGLQYNAYTTLQSQHYFYTHLSEKSELALNLLIDGLTQSIFSEKSIDEEKKVILSEERENFADPASYIWRLSNRALWTEDSLGKDFYGNERTIQSIKKTDLQAFFQNNFSAPRILFVFINSSLSSEDQEDALSKVDLSSDRLVEIDPVLQPRKKRFLFEKRATDLDQISLAFPSISIKNSEERVIQDLIGAYLASGWTSKLINRLRVQENICYWVNQETTLLEKTGSIRFSFAVKPENSVKALSFCQEEFELLSHQELPQEELDTLKTKYVSQVLRDSLDYTWLMNWYGYTTLLVNKPLNLSEYLRILQEVTVSDFREFAEKYLGTEKMTTAVIGKVNSLAIDREQ